MTYTAQSDMIQVSKERTSHKVGEVEIMKKYYIIDKRDRNAESEAKAYTFEELKACFQPPEDFPEELIEEWESIEDLYDLREFLEHEAGGMAQPYEFETENE